jgi:hypothetical protein
MVAWPSARGALHTARLVIPPGTRTKRKRASAESTMSRLAAGATLLLLVVFQLWLYRHLAGETRHLEHRLAALTAAVANLSEVLRGVSAATPPPPPPPLAIIRGTPGRFAIGAAGAQAVNDSSGRVAIGNLSVTAFVPAANVQGPLLVQDVVVTGSLWVPVPGSTTVMDVGSFVAAHQTLSVSCPLVACAQGVLVPDTCQCACLPHWLGPQCDTHDCHGHGVFMADRCVCATDVPWAPETMCQLQRCSDGTLAATCAADAAACTLTGCAGVCSRNRCLCTTPGTMGPLCTSACGTPVVGACTERWNWGHDECDPAGHFCVCGGGFEPDRTILRVRALVGPATGANASASLPTLFAAWAAVCCAPGQPVCDTQPERGAWSSWIYPFEVLPGTIADPFAQDEYLRLYDACPDVTNATCLAGVRATINGLPWPDLRADRADPLVFGALRVVGTDTAPACDAGHWYLTLDTTTTPTFLVGGPALWRCAATVPRQLLAVPDVSKADTYHIFLALPHKTFCLADRRGPAWTAVVFGATDGDPTTAYWRNIMDLDGARLPTDQLCGRFALPAWAPRDTPGSLVLGPAAGGGARVVSWGAGSGGLSVAWWSG